MLNQKGVAQLLILTTAVGIITFLVISNSASFKDSLFGQLFPKPSSFAIGPGIVLLDSNNQPVTQTSTPNIKVELTSPWPPTGTNTTGFSLIKGVFAQSQATTGTGESDSNIGGPGRGFDNSLSTPKKTPTPTPGATVLPTPTPKTASAIVAEDANFTQNIKVLIPFISNPTVVDYVLSSTGNKTIYVKFTADNGQTQIYQASINYVIPSPTLVPSVTPTPSPGAVSLEYGTWNPNPTWDTCTKAEHNSYFVIGDDGKKYSTWHGAKHTRVDGTTCTFGHEHGHDPRNSNADNSLPAFGYAAEQMSMLEPHVGFKVQVLNAGQFDSDGFRSDIDGRMVFHMGTGGVKRYVTQFHSMEYDLIARDGSGKTVHINIMADTGGVAGSTCTRQGNGKTIPELGCDDPYEIWGIGGFIHDPKDPFREAMHSRFAAGGAIAAFEPITVRDPADNTRLLYSQNILTKRTGWLPGLDPVSPQAQFQGCDREIYFGPQYWKNADKPTVYYTDSLGYVKGGPGPGMIRQEVSSHTGSIPTSTSTGHVLKLRAKFCGSGIHPPN